MILHTEMSDKRLTAKTFVDRKPDSDLCFAFCAVKGIRET